MEKFYLAKVTDFTQEISKSKLKLVDVQFSRKPPTFGLMYLTTKTLHKHSNDANNSNNNAISTSKQTNNKTTQNVAVNLSVMQIDNDNIANFKSLKHIDLLKSNCEDGIHKTIVDFDTSKSILLDEEDDDQHFVSTHTSQQQSIDCIILADDGSLYGVNLRLSPYLNKQAISSKATATNSTSSSTLSPLLRLTDDNEATKNNLERRLFCGSFIQCKLQHSKNDLSIFIHLLAEKNYWLYELTTFSNNKLKLINQYSMPSNSESYLCFTKVNIIEANPQVVLIELNNSSLKVIQRSDCIFSQNLQEQLDLRSTIVSNVVLSSDNSKNESILLSFAGTKILAQNLQITNHDEAPSFTKDHSPSVTKFDDKDPDKLLPKDPSFEFDQCWSIDLNDIENLRNSIEPDEEEVSNNNSDNNPFRAENDKIKYGCMMPMWSTNSQLYPLEETQRWPEYLIVTYKYHILIYSFEQQTVLPFSVVYDSSFSKLTPLNDKLDVTISNGQQQQNPKFVDVKTKPKLLQSFKLIGSNPTDVLFNNILLSNTTNNNLVECGFFPLLNLIISITNNGDMFAFKLSPSSTKLELHKDNLFQQQYAKAISGDSLLKDQMNRLQKELNCLKDNIERLEEKSMSISSKKGQESNHLASLIQTELRQSDETECLYYISMCLSNLIKVSQIIIMSSVNSYILKPVSSTNCQTINIKNSIDRLIKNNMKLNSDNVLEHTCHDSIQSWALLDLEKEDPAMSRVIKLNLPLLITDKQQGSIRVFYVLDDCPRKRPIGSFYHPMIRSHLSNSMESTLIEGFNESNTMFHIEELQIKPLMSYKQVSKDVSLFVDTEKALVKLTITGLYKRDSMISWLAECFQSSIDLRQSEVKLKSQFNHLLIEYNMADPNNQLLISSDDVTTIDLIKKHVLKRATDESTKLNVSQSPLSSTVISYQNQINESRLKLISLIETTLPNVEKSNDQSESVDLIIDSLMSEISNLNQGLPVDFNERFEVESGLENSLKRDLKKLINESENK